MRNSEFGIIFVPHICHEFRRSGFYIRPIKNLAFIVIFCRGRVVRPESRNDFRCTKILQKQNVPIFNGFIRWK